MPTDRSPTHRSGLFILSFQLDGLCSALRQVVPYGLPVGPPTVELLRRFKSTFEGISTGPVVEGLPDIDDACNPADLLVVAEVLKASLLAFMTPEELEEQRTALGFRHVGHEES